MQPIIEKNGVRIESLDTWRTVAAPKGGTAHWVEGRSAFEVARAWCGPEGPCVPPEILALLGTRTEFQNAVIDVNYLCRSH